MREREVKSAMKSSPARSAPMVGSIMMANASGSVSRAGAPVPLGLQCRNYNAMTIRCQFYVCSGADAQFTGQRVLLSASWCSAVIIAAACTGRVGSNSVSAVNRFSRFSTVLRWQNSSRTVAVTEPLAK